jgi:hypothetical protein
MNSITLRYIGDVTTEDEIIIKDFSFRWIEKYWDERISLSGQREQKIRGYEPVLELQFEQDTQLKAVLENIFDCINSGGTVQYVDDGGVLRVVPESGQKITDYLTQVSRKPATLVLMGNIQKGIGFNIAGVLCGSTIVRCGATNVLCGG